MQLPLLLLLVFLLLLPSGLELNWQAAVEAWTRTHTGAEDATQMRTPSRG